MHHDEFNVFVDDVIDHVRGIMGTKNSEYASEGDKLENFKKGASALGCTPEECLWGYAMKHIVSIQDIVQGYHSYDMDKMREKCGDAIAYLILLEALMFERHK